MVEYTSDELVASVGRLEADYEESVRAYTEDPSETNRRRYKDLQLLVRESRRYWRGIGEACGKRSFIASSQE